MRRLLAGLAALAFVRGSRASADEVALFQQGVYYLDDMARVDPRAVASLEHEDDAGGGPPKIDKRIHRIILDGKTGTPFPTPIGVGRNFTMTEAFGLLAEILKGFDNASFVETVTVAVRNITSLSEAFSRTSEALLKGLADDTNGSTPMQGFVFVRSFLIREQQTISRLVGGLISTAEKVYGSVPEITNVTKPPFTTSNIDAVDTVSGFLDDYLGDLFQPSMADNCASLSTLCLNTSVFVGMIRTAQLLVNSAGTSLPGVLPFIHNFNPQTAPAVMSVLNMTMSSANAALVSLSEVVALISRELSKVIKDRLHCTIAAGAGGRAARPGALLLPFLAWLLMRGG